MRFKVLLTKVESAERWVNATDEEAAVRKIQEELAKPWAFTGQGQLVDTQVSVLESKPVADFRTTWSLPDGARLLSLKEAAPLMGISYGTLYKLAKQGDIACTQVGTRRFLSRESIDAFIADNTRRG